MFIPKKKTKTKLLSDFDKKWNGLISSYRVIIEHAIGGMKRFRIISNVFRGKNGSDDDFVAIVGGLWNLHLL